MTLLSRLLAAYRNRYAGCKPVKLNPTKWERWLKLFTYWWHANGVYVCLCLYLVAVAWVSR
jgi:hypothetical protein